MSSRSVEQRLRRFLLAVTAAIFIGTVFELILVNHTEETLQWIPFGLSAIGLICVAWAWFSSGPLSLTALRWVMVLVALGSLLGIWLHFSGNLQFTREINPSYSLAEAIWPAMQGSYPLMAPGVLFLAGTLGFAATWKHPLLR